MHTTSLQVQKTSLTTTRIAKEPRQPLADGQVRVAVERFALTSNNITYGAFGDAMQYWQFFPVTGADSANWGQIPVWGFGTVQESRHPEVPLGERLYGYFPMASDVVLNPVKVSAASLSDGAAHRAALHPVYNQYTRTASDPFYRSDTEDLQALLRPLFITSWLIDDFLSDNTYFGAASANAKPVMLLSSASSKTAYGTAFQMHQRGGTSVVGLTSERNREFCESLGCYDRVLSYEELPQIPADAPCVYIDFAGNAALRLALHSHCRGLTYSCSVGGTHVSELGSGRDLPGPRPTLFFAPAQIKKRTQEWGAQVLGQRLLVSWNSFVATVGSAGRPWMQVMQHRGTDAAQAAYREVLAGQGDPRIGHMLSLME